MYIPEIPNNSLTKELIEIVDIAKKLEGVETFEFDLPATEIEIKALEEHINCSLPEEYKELLRFSNGMTLNGSTAEFFSTVSIADFYDKEKVDNFPAYYIVLANIIGDGEVLCLSRKTGKFIRYFDGEERFFDTFKEVLVKITDFIKDVDEDYLLEE